jgi:hypothetical protein
MKCPTCIEPEMVHDTRDIPYTYKEETTVIFSAALVSFKSQSVSYLYLGAVSIYAGPQ